MSRASILTSLLVLLSAPDLALSARAPIPGDYAPNEILIKFRQPVASALEQQLGLKLSVDKFKLSVGLDELNARHRLKKIQPVFKDFKKNRQRLNALLKKDKATLTQKEKHILRRLKRAPKDAKVPDLSRIYKIELDLDPGDSLEKAVQAYNNHPDVEYAELNHIVSIHLAPGDPYYLIQWPLNNVGQDYPVTGGETASGTSDADIDAPEAWSIHAGTSDVIVAVLDTGVDYNHRDLQGNMWADANGCCGHDFINDDNDPMDDNGHGTHCSGIIAAKGDNCLDIAGVCWDARIMGLKFLGADGYGDITDAVEAFYYAVDNGADVVSNSWGGGGYSETAQQAIDYAYSQGVIMVAAAGNDNRDLPTYPANNDHVFAVTATDSDDQKASFSNYGDWVDIAAPGVDVLSLRADGTDIYLGAPDYTPGDNFVPYGGPDATMYICSGTSMACPHVAGASALLVSLNPTLTSDQLYDILMQTVDPIQAGICLSDGRLNLCNAVAAAIPSKGHLSLDRDYYSCSGAVSVVLVDRDLMGIGTQAVTFTTSGGDWEIIILNEKTPAVGVFSGTVYTSAGDPNAGDGKLQVAHEQIIAVTYYDANDGTGAPSVETDAATADCEPPVISDVEVEVPGPEPKVIFRTNEPTAARVSCRLSCAEPNIIVAAHSRFTTSHTVRLIGVSPITDYYFLIEAADVAGNRTIDDNNGACRAFSTDGPRDIHVPIQCLTIQEAIDISWDGGTVVVADGTYTGPGNRDLDFKGKAVTLRSENGPANCIIDCQGSFTTPHCGFYFHNAEDALSVLNGFTITGGHAKNEGGGIKCVGSSPKITNCIVAENLAVYCGGGMDNYVSNPILTDCVFTRNTVGVLPNDFFGGGAGMGNFLSSPILRNCTFTKNRGISGGGIYNEYSNPTLTNCMFVGNQAYVHDGGAIWNLSSSPTLTNCTFSGNKGGQGGAIFCADGSNATVTDCILWDDWAVDGNEIALHAGFQEGASSLTVSYSDIQGGATGVYVGGDSRINWEAGNIDDDPNFVQRGRWDPNGFWLAGDYHLLAGSPCIDAGAPNSDWGYEPWPNGGRVNMGAYGNTREATRSSADFEDLAQICAYWLEYDPLLDIAPEPAGDGVINFLDFAVFANCWLW